MYQIGFFPSKKSTVKTIVMGNLAIGGSGKTPFTDTLITQLKKEKNIAFLSRGYGRKSTGIIKIESFSTSAQVGDEPKLIGLHHPELPAYVGENRLKAAEHIHHQHPDVSFIVLDDAFQHRALIGDITILLTRYQAPFYKDYLWPRGGLRDLKSRAQTADLIVFTGTPKSLDQNLKKSMIEQVSAYSTAPVFFSHTQSMDLQPLFGHDASSYQQWGSFCGIAHPTPFHHSVKNMYNTLETLNFDDHHQFVPADLNKIKAKMVNFGGQVEAWITTEKDAMRILEMDDWKGIPIFYMPIVIKINEEEEKEWNLWWKKKI